MADDIPARFTAHLLDRLERDMGLLPLEAWLRRGGVTRQQLRAPGAWIRLEFFERLLDLALA